MIYYIYHCLRLLYSYWACFLLWMVKRDKITSITHWRVDLLISLCSFVSFCFIHIWCHEIEYTQILNCSIFLVNWTFSYYDVIFFYLSCFFVNYTFRYYLHCIFIHPFIFILSVSSLSCPFPSVILEVMHSITLLLGVP